MGFARYLMSAGAATIVDIAFVQLLLASGFASTPVLYAGAIALGALCGMAVNFTASRRFVFARDSRAAHHQLASFFLVSLSTLLLRLVVAFTLVGVLALPVFGWIGQLPLAAPYERAAHLGAVGLVMIYSYFAHKHISFAGGILAFLANKGAVRP
ncbi:MAG: GtrA family protein [Devosia sp.]